MSPKHHSSLSERMTPTTCPTTGPTCGWLETCTSDFGLRNTVKSHSLRVLIILAALVMLCHVYVMFNSLTLPNFIVVHIPIHIIPHPPASRAAHQTPASAGSAQVVSPSALQLAIQGSTARDLRDPRDPRDPQCTKGAHVRLR